MKNYEVLSSNNGVNTCLKSEVFYSLGGMNYFTGKEEPRGYYASVGLVKQEHKNGYTTESFMMFDKRFGATKTLLVPVKRKSDKAYTQAVQAFHTSDVVQAMQQRAIQHSQDFNI